MGEGENFITPTTGRRGRELNKKFHQGEGLRREVMIDFVDPSVKQLQESCFVRSLAQHSHQFFYFKEMVGQKLKTNFQKDHKKVFLPPTPNCALISMFTLFSYDLMPQPHQSKLLLVKGPL